MSARSKVFDAPNFGERSRRLTLSARPRRTPEWRELRLAASHRRFAAVQRLVLGRLSSVASTHPLPTWTPMATPTRRSAQRCLNVRERRRAPADQSRYFGADEELAHTLLTQLINRQIGQPLRPVN